MSHQRRDRAHTAGRGRDRECCRCGRTRARLRTYDAPGLGGGQVELCAQCAEVAKRRGWLADRTDAADARSNAEASP